MKYSYNWLKELSGTKKSPKQLAELLMMHSFEVESIEKTGQGSEGVVVGKILEIKKHPNADKLQLVKVDIGSTTSAEVKQLNVVCGAWNIKVGDKVPVALPGAKLAGGFEIKEAEIRGVRSQGMLCAEDELGLGTDHSGILILDAGARIGNNFGKDGSIVDSVLEIKVLADRSHDALSHVGMVREIAASENKKMDYDYDGFKLSDQKTKKITVEIKDKKLCPRYIAAVLENITVKESPSWLKERLIACGLRPINNVVDATNYIMLELGQPLHAFDLNKIKGGKITVRTAKKGEKIILLDGKSKYLKEGNLLITDSQKVLAVAGVMGGVDSGINENTKTIVLESANFNAISIRKTRMELGIKTDASDRFERDIDPNLAEKAMVRAVEIIGHIAGGRPDGTIDVYPKKVLPWKIKLDLDYANELLGENISAKEIAKILKYLELQVIGVGSQVKAVVPTFRLDLKTQEDLIEEIGRIFGYEKIKSIVPQADVTAARINSENSFTRKAKDILVGLGFDEMYNYSFYGEKDASNAGLGGIMHLELENPMNPEQKYLRTSLIPNVLRNVNENLKHFEEVQIFEIGRVYLKSGKVFPEEKKMIALAVVLERKKTNAETFLILKGLLDAFLSKLGIQEVNYFSGKLEKLWHPGKSVEIRAKTDEKIGIIGEINPVVLGAFKIKKKAVIVELEVARLQEAAIKDLTYKKIRTYPVVMRDLSLFVGKNVKWEDIAELIWKITDKLAFRVELFDTYPGDKVSYGVRIHFGGYRTLEGKEVDEMMQKIILGLEKELEVTIRK